MELRSSRNVRSRQGTGPVHIVDCSVETGAGPILPGQQFTINATLQNDTDSDALITLEYGANGTAGNTHNVTVHAGETKETGAIIVPDRDLGWPSNQAGTLQTELAVKIRQGVIIDFANCGTIDVEPSGGGNGGNGGGGGNGGNGGGGNGGGGTQPGGQEGFNVSPWVVILAALVVAAGVHYYQNDGFDTDIDIPYV